MPGPKNVPWRKLDNAAKIFPATSSRTDPRVFRFYCLLREAVDGEILNRALELAVERYPMFLSVMRKGLFWYYLEKSALRPSVQPESRPPCSGLYIRDRNSLLFEVTYYKNRINLEVFHALTDGTGAICFLSELVKNYLVLKHGPEGLGDTDTSCRDLTQEDCQTDGFSKYYTGDGRNSRKKSKSFQLSGPRAGLGNLQIFEGTAATHSLLEAARKYSVSVTVLVTALFLCAIEEEMTQRQKKRPVVLMVPVNLRKYFPSQSMLNFFGWIEPGFDFKGKEADLVTVIDAVAAYFKQELDKDCLSERMETLVKLEHNPWLRATPLALKDLFMNLAARMSKSQVTAILSNVGSVQLPPVYEPYIERFGVFTSTPKIELCLCSFQDTMTFSFTSVFQNPNIPRNFFRLMRGIGVDVAVQEPDYPHQRENAYPSLLFFQWCTLLCITAAIGGFMANVIFTPGLHWSYLLAAGSLTMWLTLAVGYYKRHNLMKNAVWQLFLVSALCLLWDRLTGWHGWSVDYSLPCASLVTICFMLIISKARKLKPQQYMIYYIASGLFGMVPLILLLFGFVHMRYLSVICGGVSFLFLTALAIFKWRDMSSELRKKLHL